MGKRGRLLAAGVAGAVLVAVVGTVLFGGPGAPALRGLGVEPLLGPDRTGLSEALDKVPSGTKRLSFTDWSEVRDALDADLDVDSGRGEVEAMISRAYDTDFSAVSSIDEAAGALQEKFGFSPATMAWEAFAQSDHGAAMVARMPDGFDLGRVREHLDELGYTEPDEGEEIWRGGIDLTASIDPTITPELQYVAVLDDEHLVVSSDTEQYLEQVLAVVHGGEDSLGDLDDARDLVDPLAEPAAAMFWARDFSCEDLSMGQSDDQTQDQADARIAEVGKISPLTGLVMAMGGDRSLTVAAQLESDDVAQDNLRPRAELAVGEAVGRGGTFADDFELTSSTTEGRSVLLRLEPREDSGYVLSALDSGPVIFATC